MNLVLSGGGRRGHILLNEGFEEGNRDDRDGSAPDNYPDWVAGDRVDPTDGDIEKATLHLRGSGTGRWKLVFPPQIKVWRAAGGKYKQVLSGVVSPDVKLPQTISLLSEGIEVSRSSSGLKLQALLTGAKTKVQATDAVSFVVYNPRDVGAAREFHGSNEEVRPTPTPNPWSQWPFSSAASHDWAQNEARLLKNWPSRPRRVRGNGLPVVTIASPPRGVVLKNLPSLTGLVKALGKLSSINRITLRLSYHDEFSKANGYWNGSKWIKKSDVAPTLTAQYHNGHWEHKGGLPTRANLRSGIYFLEVRAYDTFNQWGYTTSTFVVDRNPRLTIQAPVEGTQVATFDTISGTATSIGATGPISSVQLRLARTPIGAPGYRQEYWNGTAWVAEPVAPLPATFQRDAIQNNQVNWQWKSAFPQEAALVEGDYQVTVAATDQAGNRSYSQSRFLVWRRPKLSFTSPALTRMATVTTAPPIEGFVQLIPGGIPVTEVKVRVQFWREIAKTEFWNGTAWVPQSAGAAPTSLPAVYTPPVTPDTIGKWKLESPLPVKDTWPEGRYAVFAQAYNEESVVAEASSGFRVDRGPLITIAWPTNQSTIAALSEVHGTAYPGITSASINSIVLSLTRLKAGGNESWNGTTWVPVPSWTSLSATWVTPATSSTGGNWKRDSGWPSLASLEAGHYYLTAGVKDADGRVTNQSISFQVKRK